MKDNAIGIIGASSFVGRQVQRVLMESEIHVVALSRKPQQSRGSNITWYQIDDENLTDILPAEVKIKFWICVAPIWILPQYFDLLEASGVTRVLALSSTSRFTKDDSVDPLEQSVARRLAASEEQLQSWAEYKGIEWLVLRPTLIYGLGLDKNITEIRRFIRRWHFFPLLGKGLGLRQPVHVNDVAQLCYTALMTQVVKNRAYNISGGEVLAYTEMVARVFHSLGKTPRFMRFPRWVFQFVISILRCVPRFQNWSSAMVDRMEQDLVFDHSEASSDLGFSPRNFNIDCDANEVDN